MFSSGRDDEEFMAWLRKSCEEQDVPLVVTDPLALNKATALFGKLESSLKTLQIGRVAA